MSLPPDEKEIENVPEYPIIFHMIHTKKLQLLTR